MNGLEHYKRRDSVIKSIVPALADQDNTGLTCTFTRMRCPGS